MYTNTYISYILIKGKKNIKKKTEPQKYVLCILRCHDFLKIQVQFIEI